MIVNCSTPTIRDDLAPSDRQFGYPEPPSFRITAPVGLIPAYDPARPRMLASAGETSMDVEYAHALVPDANIPLVETPVAETQCTTGFPETVESERYVIDLGLGSVISQSFGAVEAALTGREQLEPLRAAHQDAYAHQVPVLASSGETGAAGVAGDAVTTQRPAGHGHRRDTGFPPGWQLGSGISEGTQELAAIVVLANQAAGHRLGPVNPALYALAARHLGRDRRRQRCVVPGRRGQARHQPGVFPRGKGL